MWRNIASNALSLFVVILAVVGGLVTWSKNQYEKPGPLTQAVCLQVASGANMRRVAADLDGYSAISYPYIFRTGADYSGKSGQLKAGSFLVPEGSSMAQIVDIVTRRGASTCGTKVNFAVKVNGVVAQVLELDPATKRFVETASFVPGADETPESYVDVRDDADTRYQITLTPGVTSWQVVEALRAADFLTGEIREFPSEGSLAPNSYEVAAGSDRNELLSDMASAQAVILANAWANRSDGLPIDTPQQAMILASIVEKETGLPEERRQVASVFINRLKSGMRLQTDPTVIYGVTKGQGVLGRGLRQSELRSDTAYNTYVIDGLPPTPIANPGKESIEAALNPDQTPFIFFVADGTGGHAFAETLNEHNNNVAAWRKIEAARASE